MLASGLVNYWTGSEGRRFEEEFARSIGAKHAVALANGTLALEAALMALGVGQGDEVVVTPRSFMASASCVLTVGATPVFADVDSDSQNLTAETVERVITPRTKAVIAVHLAGWPCDMDPLVELCRPLGIALIEDCAQAHGAAYKGTPVGRIGRVGTWSFCQDKIITTAGEGGMATTDDSDLFEAMWSLKDHGKSRRKMAEAPNGGGYKYVHDTVGSNWRLTEVQSAIGRVQLGKLPAWSAARRRNAARLAERLSMVPGLRTPIPGPDVQHAYYKFYTFLELDQLADGWSQDRVLSALAERGVKAIGGVCGTLYRELPFESRGLAPQGGLPVAEQLAKKSLCLQVHPTLTDEYIDYVGSTLADVMREATGRS